MSQANLVTSYFLADALRRRTLQWIVQGLIVTSMTVISGKPKSGKSALILHLLASILLDVSFLGREVAAVRRIIVVGTDADAVGEYSQRLTAAGVTPLDAGERLILVQALRLDADSCAQLSSRFAPQQGDLMIFDHLSDMAGDFNSQADVAGIFAAIRAAAGEASVIVLAHSSTAVGQHGYSPTKPLGSTVISAKARWLVHVEERGNNQRRITTSGNGSKGETIHVSVGSHVADLTVLDIVTAEQKQEKRKVRNTETLGKRGLQLQWFEENCSALSKAEAAKKLAAQFGGNARTWQNHLAPSGWLGKMIASRSHGLTVSSPIT